MYTYDAHDCVEMSFRTLISDRNGRFFGGITSVFISIPFQLILA